MRKIALAAAGLTLALASPASAGTGPYSGSVTQGETDWHYYNNNPRNQNCPDVMKWYTVAVSWTPTSDTLTLAAGGESASNSGGWAGVSFMASACTAFSISVTGTTVASSASYTVTVTSSYGGGV